MINFVWSSEKRFPFLTFLPSICFQHYEAQLYQLWCEKSHSIWNFKVSSLLNCMHYVLTSQRALRTYVASVLTCQLVLRAHVLTCQRSFHAHVPMCLACLWADVPACLACFAYLRAHVLKLQMTKISFQ